MTEFNSIHHSKVWREVVLIHRKIIPSGRGERQEEKVATSTENGRKDWTMKKWNASLLLVMTGATIIGGPFLSSLSLSNLSLSW